MPTEETTTEAPEQESEPKVEMCCDGSGRTAEEHRAESPDHKCCIDK
jgi:transposase